jgi:hypothetical protein
MMKYGNFEQWWDKTYSDKPHWTCKVSFEEGFVRGYKEAMKDASTQFLKRFAVGILLGCGLFLLFGCEDRYRYPCQNPENFYKEQCQKPKCLFTQQCPEYLVAPILEKQVERPAPEPQK